MIYLIIQKKSFFILMLIMNLITLYNSNLTIITQKQHFRNKINDC